ncbi:hypothetical protein ACJRO7_010722 [Eucalyptus globulus]|uniref:Uncharacterized protein n=1 Tax=Eucalyptus globulus TaxID=34317 RepID=A0ABD3LHJ4_EUCGL
MHFGIPEEVTEIETHFPIHPHPEGLEYVLIKSTVWVDVGKDDLRPHEHWLWYHEYHDGRREGPMPKGDVPLFVLEEAFGEGTADSEDAAVTDARDPKLEGDTDSPKQFAVDSNWSMPKEKVDQEEVYSKENWEEEPEEEKSEKEEPEEEDPSEELKEESEEDPEDDPEYDPNED